MSRMKVACIGLIGMFVALIVFVIKPIVGMVMTFLPLLWLSYWIYKDYKGDLL